MPTDNANIYAFIYFVKQNLKSKPCVILTVFVWPELLPPCILTKYKEKYMEGNLLRLE